MTDLHLVSWNRPKMTEAVIKTIWLNTKPENFRLVVLDNGSSPETVTMLQHYKDVKLIDDFVPISTNLGLEAARNLMLKNCTQSERFICIDNDCLPTPIEHRIDWVERLNALMDAQPEYAAISCRTQVMIGTGNIFEDADEHGTDLVDFPHPGGSLRLMNTDAVLRVGGWERKEPGRGAEERYICGKLRDAGYRTAFAAQIPTLHLFGTRGDMPTDRWGYPAEWKPEQTGHSDIDHPALRNGDDYDEVVKFTNPLIANEYFYGHSNS